MHKVFWTSQEWQLLADKIEALQYETPGLGRSMALERAQLEVLGEQRRRKVSTWSAFGKTLDPLIDQARQRRKEREAAAAAVPAPPTPEQLAANAHAQKVEKWLELTADLLAPLAARLLQHPTVRSEIQKLMPFVAARPPAVDTFASAFSAAETGVDRKPRVLVAGLLPSQAGEVSSELAQVMELRFWSTDESKDKLRTLAKNCQVAVGVTSFLSHPADASLAALAPRYVRHSGGITRLKETLRTVLQN